MNRKAVLAGAIALAAGADAGAQTFPVMRTGEVVVTASRFDDPRAELPPGSTVITAREIERSSARTIVELLSRQAGIHVRDASGSPDRQVDLRGFGITGDQNTLILVDGQRISENELVAAKLSAIPLADVERIEILRSSGAVQYGSGATGGVINIVTRSGAGRELAARASASAGSYGTAGAQVAGSVGSDAMSVGIAGNWFDTDNYRDENAVRQYGAELTLRAAGGPARFSLKAGGDRQKVGLPGARTAAQVATDPRGATSPGDWATRDGERVLAQGSVKGDAVELAADLGWLNRRAAAHFQGFGADIATSVDSWSFSPRVRVGGTLAGMEHTLALGIDWDSWKYSTSVSGFFFPSEAAATQRNLAAWVRDTIAFGGATQAVLGGRIQRTENRVEEQVPFPASVEQARSPWAAEFSLRHQLSDPFSVYGRAGHSFRIATVDENRFQPQLLEPQTSDDLEVGAEYRQGTLRARLSAYAIRLDNEIYFVPFAPPFGANVNLPPTRRQGAELEAAWSPVPGWDLSANYAYMSARFREGVFGGVSVAGNEIPLVPTNTLNAALTWALAESTRLTLSAGYVGHQRFDNDQDNLFPIQMPSYTLVDLKLAHEAGPWALAATVTNLFDRAYFSYGQVTGPTYVAYPQAGRAINVSAEYRFR